MSDDKRHIMPSELRERLHAMLEQSVRRVSRPPRRRAQAIPIRRMVRAEQKARRQVNAGRPQHEHVTLKAKQIRKAIRRRAAQQQEARTP